MEILCLKFDLIAYWRWTMEHRTKTTRSAAKIVPLGSSPQALHHFALARARELQLLAERCTSAPLKAHAAHGPGFWSRLFSRRNIR
jgi:hypothetical protein